MESDAAKMIGDDSSSGVEDTVLTLKINPGTKFGTLIKPMLSIFDVIIFRFNGIIKQPALFLAIAEVYKTEGNEAYLKDDYSNAVYFYTEGIKVNCKDEDLKAKLYSNRAYANLRLGKATCILKIKKYCLLRDRLTTDVECLLLALEWSVRGLSVFTDLICFEFASLRLL